MSVKISGVLVDVPTVPNFLKMAGGGDGNVSITMLTDEDIDNLALAWASALKARRRVIEKED